MPSNNAFFRTLCRQADPELVNDAERLKLSKQQEAGKAKIAIEIQKQQIANYENEKLNLEQ